MQKVIKRDGRIATFDPDKITAAIWKAAEAIGGQDKSMAEQICEKVLNSLNENFKKDHYPTVEQVQDLVEKTLIESGHAKTAKAYILYRHERTLERRLQEKIIGSATKLPLSINGLEIFEKQFKSSPEELFKEVSERFSNNKKEEELFYKLLSELKFLPHPHILKNANQEGICFFHEFIVPANLDHLQNAAKLMQTGAEIAINLEGRKPSSVLKLFQSAAEIYGHKQNLAILPPDHPEKLSVLKLKEDEHSYFEILEENESLLPESSLPGTNYKPIALGWINLKTVPTEELNEVANIASIFLKRVFEKSSYPLAEIKEQAENQHYSLGLMGLAEILYEQNIPYNSYGAGVFVQNILGKMQNYTVNLIGNETVAEIFNTTNGIEPFSKKEHLEKIAIQEGFHTPRLITAISQAKSLQPFTKEIPEKTRELVLTLKDLETSLPREHRSLQKTLLQKAKKWVTT